MAAAQDKISIKTTDQQDNENAQAISSNLKKSGYNVEPQDVVALTSATPIPQTSELKEVGAEIVGEDVSHIVGTTVGELTYGVSKVRMTKSGRFLAMLKNKLFRRKGLDEEVVEK